MDFFSRGDAGVIAEIRNVVRKKTEVEVLPVVDLSGKSASDNFFGERCNPGVERPEHVSRSSAGIQMCVIIMYRRTPCVPRSRKREKERLAV